jgi:hypothetical protein
MLGSFQVLENIWEAEEAEVVEARCSHVSENWKDSIIGFPPCFVFHITTFSCAYIYRRTS